jgi:hypothetical protein
MIVIRRRYVQIIGLLLLVAVIIGTVTVRLRLKTLPSLKVLDQRLAVIDWEFKRAKFHSAYFGGLEGRLRQKLHEYGFPVTRLGGVRISSENETLVFAICYGGRFSPAEAGSIEAIVVDGDGTETKLGPPGEFNMPSRGEYGRVWILNQEFSEGSSLLIRIGTNLPLAIITAKK